MRWHGMTCLLSSCTGPGTGGVSNVARCAAGVRGNGSSSRAAASEPTPHQRRTRTLRILVAFSVQSAQHLTPERSQVAAEEGASRAPPCGFAQHAAAVSASGASAPLALPPVRPALRRSPPPLAAAARYHRSPPPLATTVLQASRRTVSRRTRRPTHSASWSVRRCLCRSRRRTRSRSRENAVSTFSSRTARPRASNALRLAV